MIVPVEAVKAYHAVLAKLGVAPHRPLEQDLTLQTSVMSYGGSTATISLPPASTPSAPSNGSTPDAKQSLSDQNGAPNFAAMTSDERLAFHRERLKRRFGA